MAVGIPIVATRVGGIPYVVKDKDNGLLCDYGDVETFAQNMILLLNDATLKNQFILNNIEKCNR